MGSDESKPSSPTNRGSNVHSLRSSLHDSVSEFLRLYEQKKGRLKEIINQLKEIPAEIERVKKKAKTGQTAAIVTSAVGVSLGILAIPLTGGLSLLALGTGLTAGIAGGATSVGVATTKIIKSNASNKKDQSLRAEFRAIIESLKEKLENVGRRCKELRAKEADVNKILKLLKIDNKVVKETGEIMSATNLIDTDWFEESLTILEPLFEQVSLTLKSYYYC